MIFFVFIAFNLAVVFAQNEASKKFLEGTVLTRQAGNPFDKFPKMELGFVGRKAADTGEPQAFLFIRFQSATETSGGIVSTCFFREEKQEGNSTEQFVQLLATFYVVAKRADDQGLLLDMDLGEIELADFQWYMVENQWKSTYYKTCRIKLKMQTVGKEHRLYFYRTSPVKDYRNEFYTFTMPDDTFLTAEQCHRIANGYSDNNSFFWKAVQVARDSVSRTIR
jgi:hypothetical protein